MKIEIPVFTAIRWMVFELDRPFRGFATKREAEEFAKQDKAFDVRQIPKTYKAYEFEEAPF